VPQYDFIILVLPENIQSKKGTHNFLNSMSQMSTVHGQLTNYLHIFNKYCHTLERA